LVVKLIVDRSSSRTAGARDHGNFDRVQTSPERFERLDALRGLAMLWMAVFHFDFDLNHFGFVQPRQAFFHDPFWTWQRAAILGTFLFTAGASLAVAMARGQTWGRFLRRWWQVAACALLVSVATWVVFPGAWVWFGVLHGVAAMLLLTRLLASLGVPRTLLLVLGAALVFVLPHFQTVGMEATAVRWLGMGLTKPITQDWVPLVPWLGVMLIGFALGQWAWLHRRAWLVQPVAPAVSPLVTLGRWSLSFYVVHQPLFFGLVYLASRALAR
jgi:uncharacterized membrane protein